ncbi:MAG: hypothetical protein M3376_08450 [Actinomycetota bacterium]|nr:hypothetical protein [Actinomycetota bacterium]
MQPSDLVLVRDFRRHASDRSTRGTRTPAPDIGRWLAAALAIAAAAFVELYVSPVLLRLLAG